MFGKQHASGKKIQEILEEALIRPLNIQGELYIGIPAGTCQTSLFNILISHSTKFSMDVKYANSDFLSS